MEGEILSISDREQQRLGEELHDGLCQQLAAIGLMTRATALRLKNHRVIQVEDLENITRLINDSAISARKLARDLHRDLRPALLALQGAAPTRHRSRAVLDADYAKRPGRMHAIRCALELREDGWHARPTKEQGSHILTSMLGADALALVPADSGSVRAGEMVEIELLPGF